MKPEFYAPQRHCLWKKYVKIFEYIKNERSIFILFFYPATCVHEYIEALKIFDQSFAVFP